MALVCLSAGGWGQPVWVGQSSSNWSDPANWNPAGVPAGVAATVNTASGNIATVLSSVIAQPGRLSLGDGTNGTLNVQPGGSLTVNGELWVGNNHSGYGLLNMSGGSLTVSNWLVVGRLANTMSHGAINLTGGTLTVAGSNPFNVGEGSVQSQVLVSNATLNINSGEFWIGQNGQALCTLAPGGAINCSNWVVIGRANGTGVFNMTGGTFAKAGPNHFVMGNGSGAFNQSGGNLSVLNGAEVRLTETGSSLYNMTGGAAQLNTVVVGNLGGGSAELRIGGTAMMTAGNIILGRAGNLASVLHLSGGSLAVNQISAGGSSGSKTIHFNGGTLVARADAAAFLNGMTMVHVRAGGLKIDDGGHSITIAQPLLHSSLSGDGAIDGGLTKLGTGTVRLAEACSYTGDTVIAAGTLQWSALSALPGAVRLTNGATLQLDTAGTWQVGSLYTNGVALADGIYDAVNLAGFVSGPGRLQVGITPVSYTYTDLIGTLTNLERLAQLPPVGERSAEWTSRDQASTYNPSSGQYENWGANDDFSGHLGMQPDGGIILAQMSGPGCLWRIWSAQTGPGHVKIFLDGSSTPAVDIAFRDYFNGSQFPFNYPALNYVASGGFNSYLPIPYNVSCKVVGYGDWGRYFQVGYTTFGPGVTVPTFTTNLTTAEQAALANVNDFLLNQLGSDPAGSRSGEVTVTNTYSIASGQNVTPLDFGGAGAITGFKVQLKNVVGASARWQALRELTVSLFWDGETNASVWGPLGDFFGGSCGYIPYQSLPLGMQSNGWMYCYWYMPFASGARIVLGNDGNITRDVDVIVTHAPLTHPIESLARFHAKWSRGSYLTNGGRSPDYRFLETTGRGRFVGLTMNVYQEVDVSPGPWWGEGDEKFFVDGEIIPSWFGTGSEDYFGFAWGTPGYFSRPYHSQLLSPPGNHFAPGNRALNRVHIVDDVPFQSSFEGCLEKWNFTDESNTRFGMMPFWYLASGGVDAYGPQSLDTRTNYYVPDRVFAWLNPNGGLWSAAANWQDSAVAEGASTGADFSGIDLTTDVTVQLDAPHTIGTLTFGDADTGSAANWILENNGNSANALTLSGGTATISVNSMGAGASAVINANVISTGNLTTDGDGVLRLAGSNSLAGLIVNCGTNVISGTTTVQGTGATKFYLGNADTSYSGTMILEPGGTLTVSGSFGDSGVIGRDGGHGTFIQNGGTFDFNPVNVNYLFIGAANHPATRAEYRMNGGLLDMNNHILGISLGAGAVITGMLNQVDGVITNVSTLNVGALTANGFGAYNLSGGRIHIGSGGITTSSGSYHINLGGGTVGALAGWSSPLNMTLTGSNGPVTFDTAANSVSLSGALSGSGGLNKIGSGTLELVGANTYAGETSVVAGSLKLSSTNSKTSAIRLSDGASLNLNYNGVIRVENLLTNNAALPAGTYHSGNLPNYLTGTGSIEVVVGTASTPTSISYEIDGGMLSLSWPASHAGWILQRQTNALEVGLGANWVDVAGTGMSTNALIAILPAIPCAFFRLRYPAQ